MNGMMNKVVDSVYSNAGKMPVIIFFHGDKENDCIFKFDKLVAGTHFTSVYKKLMNGAQILAFKEGTKSVQDGVYVIDQNLYRGFDIKMAMDAHVIVVDTDGSLNTTTAN